MQGKFTGLQERIEAEWGKNLLMHLITRVSLKILVILGDVRDPGAQTSSEVQQQTFVIFQLVLLCWHRFPVSAWDGALPGEPMKYWTEGYRLQKKEHMCKGLN